MKLNEALFHIFFTALLSVLFYCLIYLGVKNKMIIEIIIFGLVWLVLTEFFYLRMMKDEKDMADFWDAKFAGIFVSTFIFVVLFTIYYVLKEYTKEFLIFIAIVVLFIIFFYVNYHIGESIVRRNKKKLKQNKRSKK